MRNALILACSMAMGVGMVAQEGVQATQYRPPDRSEALGCPVQFGAQVDTHAVMRSAKDRHDHPSAPTVRLTLQGPKAAAVRSASVTLHGASGTNRYLPVAAGRPVAEETQSFELTRQDSEVQATKMALVRWAELTEVKFADGSSWHESAAAGCRATPSLFRLVAAAQ